MLDGDATPPQIGDTSVFPAIVDVGLVTVEATAPLPIVAPVSSLLPRGVRAAPYAPLRGASRRIEAQEEPPAQKSAELTVDVQSAEEAGVPSAGPPLLLVLGIAVGAWLLFRKGGA
jgi:hypothetical protein